jgi:hypothetical protein
MFLKSRGSQAECSRVEGSRGALKSRCPQVEGFQVEGFEGLSNREPSNRELSGGSQVEVSQVDGFSSRCLSSLGSEVEGPQVGGSSRVS